jgi:hypothetical protein
MHRNRRDAELEQQLDAAADAVDRALGDLEIVVDQPSKPN